MKNCYKYYLLALPFLFGMTIKQKNICGTYIIKNSEWGGHKLLLKRNGLFIETIGGCVYDIQTTGIWEINIDTLILKPIKQKDLRAKYEINSVDGITKLIIRKDTLFRINNEDVAKTFDIDSALIRRTK